MVGTSSSRMQSINERDVALARSASWPVSLNQIELAWRNLPLGAMSNLRMVSY